MKKIGIVLLGLIFSYSVFAQNYHIDKEGILRDEMGNEATFFGFNYCMPFAFGYRAHKGKDRKAAIRMDVDDMCRLGINAYRVHVWDVEISDSCGRLLENEHLDLLDYTIAQFASRGVKTMITSIAFWGNGWPEPDDKSLAGFSNHHWKQQMPVNKQAIAAQEVYLKMLMNHRNPYTGYVYKNDPSIVAIELNNEPDHTAEVPDQSVTNYINRLVEAVRSTGCRKPLVYNIAQNPNRTNAVMNANIDGISYQWYPSGLVSGKARRENFLPIVAHYNLPYDTQHKGLFIYEFDAADIDGSYMYPAMARSFREAGFQWATQFAYDPTAIAAYNTDYQTHYLNLLYTPQKAISFRIAAEAFRSIPRNTTFGQYPENNTFDDFTVDFNQNYSILNRDTIFCYSNSTQKEPINTQQLKHIAGCGNSTIVKYSGNGSYFLDKNTAQNWKLTLFPEVIYTDNAYARHNSFQHPVAQLFSYPQRIKINLPDIKIDTVLEAGIYTLNPSSIQQNVDFDSVYSLQKPTLAVVHHPQKEMLYKKPNVISAQIIANETIDSVVLFGEMMYGMRFSQKMQKKSDNYTYCVQTPKLPEGILEYYITVYQSNKISTYPGICPKKPWSWDFYSTDSYCSRIVTEKSPFTVFDGNGDIKSAELLWREGVHFDYKSNGILIEDGASNKLTYNGDAAIIMDVCTANRSFNRLKIEALITKGIGDIKVNVIDRNGYCWSSECHIFSGGFVELPLTDFKAAELTPTRDPYPEFSFAGNIRPSNHTVLSQDIISIQIFIKKSNGIILKKCELLNTLL